MAYITQKLQMLWHTPVTFLSLSALFSILQLFMWGVFTQPLQLRNEKHRKLNNMLSLITEHHLILCGPLTGPSAQVVLNAEPTHRWFWATRLHGSAYHCLTANRLQCQLRISGQPEQQGTANNRDNPVYNMCHGHTWLIIQLVLSWQGGEVPETEGKGTSILHEGGWEAMGKIPTHFASGH